jgi:formylmethanofuran dehydrogenase subunit B
LVREAATRELEDKPMKIKPRCELVWMAAMALVAFYFSAMHIRAEESASDTEKDAQELQDILKNNKLSTITGKLNLVEVKEGEKPPKMAGSLTTADTEYKIQLQRPEQYADLAKFDKQEVNMKGHVVDKQEGKTIFFEELEFAASRAPGKKKRGGI